MFRGRRAVRRIARRTSRRAARHMFHRMAIAEDDVARIENETGQAADDLTEEQLLAAMRRLGIKKLEVDDEM